MIIFDPRLNFGAQMAASYTRADGGYMTVPAEINLDRVSIGFM